MKIYSTKVPWHDPEEVFLNLFAGKKNTFWLDNNFSKTGYSYMGQATQTIQYTLSNHTLRISKNNKTKILHQDIFSYLKKKLSSAQAKSLKSNPPFIGGFVGYFGYELQAPTPKTPSPEQPDACLLYIDHFLAFNHKKKELHIYAHSKNKLHASQLFSTQTPITKNIKTLSNKSIIFKMNRSKSQYLKDIKAIQKYLEQGDAYQICLTNQVTTNLSINWLNLYHVLRQENPAPFNAYLNFDEFALLSSSPEQFLKINKKGHIMSKPMKGTIRRSNNPQEDQQLKNQLGKTTKDYAENIMIVDLLRNDLGRVSEIGTVKVTKPLAVETYATVHQLVSTVTGKLRTGLTAIDALQAAFPGGSMTGAPKIRAMEIIAELEKAPRGIYSGTFGFLSLNGEADLAMTIRTIIATKNQLSFSTGGAILADSSPEDEYNEILLKAKALINAIMKTTTT